ncbi:MAG TPA: class I SAM-dependent methyltransferase [Methanocella sp.]|jgi:methyltransferase (TIGR00027 family)
MDSKGQADRTGADGHGMEKKGPSRMAENVALIRADESRKPEDERICYDPYAIRFIGREMLALMTRYPEKFKAEMDKHNRLMPGLANSLVARVRYFDDVVEASAGEGLEQLVVLGAGYDTRPYRIESLRNVRVFEVDSPDTVNAKMEKIREIFGSLPAHVTYVPADLEIVKLGQRLEAGGYDRSKKTLFVMEGLLYYLPPEAVDETLAFIVHNSGKGSAVLFDYGRNREGKPTTSDLNGSDFARRQGEPVKSDITGPIETFLTERGFSGIRNLDSEDYKKIYFHGKNADREVYDRSSFVYAVVK